MKIAKTVVSSIINTVAYRNNNLYVLLNSGRAYEYKNVPKDVAVEFTQAKSAGQFYNKNIVGQFDSERVEV